MATLRERLQELRKRRAERIAERKAEEPKQLGRPVLTATEATGEIDISVSAQKPVEALAPRTGGTGIGGVVVGGGGREETGIIITPRQEVAPEPIPLAVSPVTEVTLQESSPLMGAESSFFLPRFGTTIEGEEGLQQVRKIDIEKERQMERLLQTGAISFELEQRYSEEVNPFAEQQFQMFQAKVDEGELSQLEAQKGLDLALGTFASAKELEYQTEFKERAGAVAEKYPSMTGLGETRPSFFEAGGTGEAILTVALPPVEGVILMGRGAKKEEKTQIVEYLPSGDPFLPLYPKYTVSKETMIGSLLLVSSPLMPIGKALTFGGMKSISMGVASAEILGVSKSPVKFGQVVFEGEKGGLILLKGSSRRGGLIQEIDLVGSFQKVGKQTFVMPKGVADVRIAGKLSENILGGKEATQILGVSRFDFGAKGTTLLGGEKLSLGLGKSVFEPKISSFGFFKAPSTLREADFMGKRLGEQFYKNIRLGGTKEVGFDLPVSIKMQKDLFFGFTPRPSRKFADVGLTKVFKITPKRGDLISIPSGAKTPFAKTFQQPLQQQVSPQIQTTEAITKAMQQQTKQMAQDILGKGKVTTKVIARQEILPTTKLFTLQKQDIGVSFAQASSQQMKLFGMQEQALQLRAAQAPRTSQALSQLQALSLRQAQPQLQRQMFVRPQLQAPRMQLRVSPQPAPFRFPFRMPFFLPLPPKLEMFETKGRLYGTRKFVATPSLGALIKFELGIEQKKFRTGLEETGLVERAYVGKVKLGSLLGKVKKKRKGGKK